MLFSKCIMQLSGSGSNFTSLTSVNSASGLTLLNTGDFFRCPSVPCNNNVGLMWGTAFQLIELSRINYSVQTLDTSDHFSIV